MAEWQPIETAPKDGTVVLAGKQAKRMGYSRIPYPLPARFECEEWRAEFSGVWARFDPQPTHWMPLPKPPTPSQERVS